MRRIDARKRGADREVVFTGPIAVNRGFSGDAASDMADDRRGVTTARI